LFYFVGLFIVINLLILLTFFLFALILIAKLILISLFFLLSTFYFPSRDSFKKFADLFSNFIITLVVMILENAFVSCIPQAQHI